MLAIQTEFQKSCYRQHATKVLCVDATHGTNAYGFKLITVMVADEFGQGETYSVTPHLMVLVHTTLQLYMYIHTLNY